MRNHLRSPDEMKELFADLPLAIERTVEIANRCQVSLPGGFDLLPDFPLINKSFELCYACADR